MDDRPTDQGREEGRGTDQQGRWEIFNTHFAKTILLRRRTDRRDGGHGRKWDGFYLPSIRRSITPLTSPFWVKTRPPPPTNLSLGRCVERERIKRVRS